MNKCKCIKESSWFLIDDSFCQKSETKGGLFSFDIDNYYDYYIEESFFGNVFYVIHEKHGQVGFDEKKFFNFFEYDKNKWIWPLPGVEKNIPETPHQGSFGAKRTFDVHCGCDIYCENNQPVIACEDGEVVEIENFTGKSAMPSTPWWNDTYAVVIKGESGHILYGEILISNLYIGKKIKAGDLIGTVTTVLKKDKGLPMNMLHLELYDDNFNESVIWNFGKSKPDTLLDPTEFLKQSIKK